MKRASVASSMIQTLGWADGTLEVQFKDGSVFVYRDVPQVVYARVAGAKSVGKRFHALVRDQYQFTQTKGARK